jgi:hypothetical protein
MIFLALALPFVLRVGEQQQARETSMPVPEPAQQPPFLQRALGRVAQVNAAIEHAVDAAIHPAMRGVKRGGHAAIEPVASHLCSFLVGTFAGAGAVAIAGGVIDLGVVFQSVLRNEELDLATAAAGSLLAGSGAGAVAGVAGGFRKPFFRPVSVLAGALTSAAAIVYAVTPATSAASAPMQAPITASATQPGGTARVQAPAQEKTFVAAAHTPN